MVCTICRQPEPEEDLLLCDAPGCSQACHLSCMGLSLQHAPPGDWFCGQCWAAGAGSRAAAPSRPGAAAGASSSGGSGAGIQLDRRTLRFLAEREQQPPVTRAVPVQQWDPRFLSGAPQLLPAWLAGRLAASSHRSLESQRTQFRQFQQLAGMPAATVPEQLVEQLACWVMGRSEHGYKFSTIELGIYAVLDGAVRSQGWRNLAQHARLRDALAVAKR